MHLDRNGYHFLSLLITQLNILLLLVAVAGEEGMVAVVVRVDSVPQQVFQ